MPMARLRGRRWRPHDDGEPSLVVTPAKNLWHCFGCQAGGGPIDWVIKTQGVSFRHAVELLRSDVSLAANEPVRQSTVPKLPAPLAFDADDQALLNQVIDYYHQTLRTSPEALAYLAHPDLAGVIICPSNPFLSVDPILAIDDIAAGLAACQAPIIAISPLVDGQALKGPTAKIMAELGLPQDATAIARHYGKLLDGFILDRTDARLSAEIAHADLAVMTAQTVMGSLDDRIDLAHTAIEFLQTLSP